jgi:hypothetical protein
MLAAPTTETFDVVTPSLGPSGAARIINGWTFSVLGAAGTIDGNPNLTWTTPMGSYTLVADAANWWII